jgi:fucose permease
LIAAPFLSQLTSSHRWHYSYYIIGLIFLTDVLWILYYSVRDEWHCSIRNTKDHKSYQEECPSFTKSDRNLGQRETQGNKWKDICLIGLLFLTFCMFVGGEHSYGNYLYSYARLYLNFPVNWAVYLNSAFGCSMAIGRLAGIFGALVLRPNHIILIDMVCGSIALTFLGLFSKSASVLWIGTIVYGFFLASLYPATIDWAQLHLHITGKMLAILIAGGATGASTIPLLIGCFFNSESVGPFVLIIIVLIVTILATLFYIFALCLSLNR